MDTPAQCEQNGVKGKGTVVGTGVGVEHGGMGIWGEEGSGRERDWLDKRAPCGVFQRISLPTDRIVLVPRHCL